MGPYAYIQWAVMLFFNWVRRYVPKYLLSKNKIILKSIFWVTAYIVDGQTDGWTDRQRHTITHPAEGQWPLLLTWFNFNPSMDK